MKYSDVALIIEKIYESEIPCRIEWMFDMGFVWSIIDGQKYPRLFIDDDLDGRREIITESPENMLLRNDPFIEKDWIYRDSDQSLKTAVMNLAYKICELYPKCQLAKWWIFNKND